MEVSCKVELSQSSDGREGDNFKMERKADNEPAPTDSQAGNDTHDEAADELETHPAEECPQVVEVKKEEPPRRGHRKKSMKGKKMPKPKKLNRKKILKRQMKPIEEDDPRYRGVPKVKRIHKRKNKPKTVSEQVKREAEIKREE
jgi:hypothetical protein